MECYCVYIQFLSTCDTGCFLEFQRARPIISYVQSMGFLIMLGSKNIDNVIVASLNSRVGVPKVWSISMSLIKSRCKGIQLTR